MPGAPVPCRRRSVAISARRLDHIARAVEKSSGIAREINPRNSGR